MTTTQRITTQTRGNWPGKAALPKRERQSTKFDEIVKSRTPYIVTRTTQASKWDAVFKGVQEGDCFEMQPEDVARGEQALRKFLEKNGIEGIVRRRTRCEDGKGRVWLLKVLKPKGGAA